MGAPLGWPASVADRYGAAAARAFAGSNSSRWWSEFVHTLKAEFRTDDWTRRTRRGTRMSESVPYGSGARSLPGHSTAIAG